MIITKKALPRRTFLRGWARALALPLLDAMVPVDDRPGRRRRPIRCAASASSTCRWDATSPAGRRRARARSIELSPTLSSLAPVRRARHGDHQPGAARTPIPGTHATSNAAFLSAAKAKRTESTDYYLGTTVDQIAAQADRPGDAAAVARAVDGSAPDGRPVRQRLRLRLSEQSLVVVADDAASGRSASAHRLRAPVRRRRQRRRPPRRAAENGRACSIRSAKTSPACSSKLGPADRAKVGQYLDTVREVERRIQKAEAETADNPLPDLDRPVGVPAAYADHARLMFDLQVLALQGDVTRVITFQLARETSNRTYPEIGVPDPHHPLTHHGNDPEKIAQDGEDQRSSTSRCSPSSSRS